MANAEHGGGAGGAFGAGAAGTAAQARLKAARVALWLLAAVLAVRQVADILGTPKADRLTDLETWVGPDGVLHVNGSLYDSTQFTGTPFGGLVLKPLTRAAEQALGWGWTFGTLLLVVALGVVAARALPAPVSRRTSLLAAPVAISLLMLSLPVRNTLHLGQTSIIPVLLVLLGCFVAREERAAGVLIGLAAALQPTVLLFAPLLWFTGRRRAAVSAGITFAACTALAWAAMADDSYTYWVHHMGGAGLGGAADDLANQSLHGALLRLGVEGPLEITLFLVLGAGVAVLGLRRAVRYARDGQLLLAVAITGCAAVAVSPTTWQHQLLWVLLAVVGRVGKRASDRYMWPVAVIIVMTLPAKMVHPEHGRAPPGPRQRRPAGRDRRRHRRTVPVPDLGVLPLPGPDGLRGAGPRPLQAGPAPPLPAPGAHPPEPAPRTAADPGHLRRVPEGPARRDGRHDTGGRSTAEAHGQQIHDIEKFLHIDIEHWVNHTVVKIGWLRDFFDFYYTSFHFIVPLTVLGVLYWRRPVDYRWARASLGFATLLALVGFWLYPLAPPRLMPGLGFIDTVHGVQDFSKPDYGTLTALTNQYAAMPSLHFGWSLWCGLVIAIVAPKWWMKALGLLHPLFTVSAIVATGNHWVLDAVGGAAVVLAGFGLSYVFMGPRARTVVAAAENDDRPRPARAAESRT